MKVRMLLFVLPALLLVAGCSKEAPLAEMSFNYGPTSVTVQKQGQDFIVSADVTMNIINRTERGQNIAFLECG